VARHVLCCCTVPSMLDNRPNLRRRAAAPWRRGRHVTGADNLAGGRQPTVQRARCPPLALPKIRRSAHAAPVAGTDVAGGSATRTHGRVPRGRCLFFHLAGTAAVAALLGGDAPTPPTGGRGTHAIRARTCLCWGGCAPFFFSSRKPPKSYQAPVAPHQHNRPGHPRRMTGRHQNTPHCTTLMRHGGRARHSDLLRLLPRPPISPQYLTRFPYRSDHVRQLHAARQAAGMQA